VELDSVLRDWPRLLRGMRTRFDVPPLHHLRAQVAGMGRVSQRVTQPQSLIGALTLLAGARHNDLSTAMAVAVSIVDHVLVAPRPRPALLGAAQARA